MGVVVEVEVGICDGQKIYPVGCCAKECTVMVEGGDEGYVVEAVTLYLPSTPYILSSTKE